MGHEYQFTPANDPPSEPKWVLLRVKDYIGRQLFMVAMYARERELEAASGYETDDYDDEGEIYWCAPGWYEQQLSASYDLDCSSYLIEGDFTPIEWCDLPQ